jgi:formylmethanofuran dehydrogenase subunit E
MNLHPWDVTIKKAKTFIDRGAKVQQQFNCEHCGVKQTMETPNLFYETGICQECTGTTDIRKNGMNFMIHLEIR